MEGLHLCQHGAHLRIDDFALGELHFALEVQSVAELLHEERFERLVRFPRVFDAPTEVKGGSHLGEFPVHYLLGCLGTALFILILIVALLIWVLS